MPPLEVTSVEEAGVPARLDSETLRRDYTGFQLIHEGFSTARTVIRTIGAIVLAYFFYRMIGELAGQTTSVTVDLLIRIFAKFQVWISIAAGTALALWGKRERTLRKRTTARLHARIKELETRLDPQRTTSTLTPRGDTNPRDRG